LFEKTLGIKNIKTKARRKKMKVSVSKPWPMKEFHIEPESKVEMRVTIRTRPPERKTMFIGSSKVPSLRRNKIQSATPAITATANNMNFAKIREAPIEGIKNNGNKNIAALKMYRKTFSIEKSERRGLCSTAGVVVCVISSIKYLII
jgi:hypothetical protein